MYQGRKKVWKYGGQVAIQVLLKVRVLLLFCPKSEGGGAIAPSAPKFLTALLPMLCTMEMDGNITTMLRGLSSTGSCSVGPQAPLVPLYCTMLDFSISPLQFKSCAVFYILQMAYRDFVRNLKLRVLFVLYKKALGLKIRWNVSTNPITKYQNFSPLANGTDLNREKYAILQTHWH